MAETGTALMRGTLQLLILKTLTLGPFHGVSLARRIQQVTRGEFRVSFGSLFPALHRMEEEGWIRSEWGRSENNRRAKYYELTAKGKRRLQTETRHWERVALAVGRVLEVS